MKISFFKEGLDRVTAFRSDSKDFSAQASSFGLSSQKLSINQRSNTFLDSLSKSATFSSSFLGQTTGKLLIFTNINFSISIYFNSLKKNHVMHFVEYHR